MYLIGHKRRIVSIISLNKLDEYKNWIASCSTGLNIKDIKVLYGGSVKSSNVAEISKIEAVDGVLVGGASLKGEEFFNIYKNSL